MRGAKKKILRGIFKIWILENNYCPFENNYCPFENNYCPFAKNYCASCQKIPRLAPSAREIFVILEVKPGYILSKFRAVGARKFCDFRGKIRRYFIKFSRRRHEKKIPPDKKLLPKFSKSGFLKIIIAHNFQNLDFWK